jgi:signal transduction histidine kinase
MVERGIKSTRVGDGQSALSSAVRILVDITELHMAEAALRASEARYRELNETLEARIAERTRELVEANERLRAEVAEHGNTEVTAREAPKLEAVGRLASGIAHDFNNIIMTILGNLELLAPHLDDPRLRNLVAAAARAASRGAQLNDRVLALQRATATTKFARSRRV